MRAPLKKIRLAAVMALTVAGVALVTAGSAQTQHWHGQGGGGFGAGFVGGLAAGAVMGGARTTEAATMVAGTPMAAAVISSGKLLSIALATVSYDACESAIKLRS